MCVCSFVVIITVGTLFHGGFCVYFFFEGVFCLYLFLLTFLNLENGTICCGNYIIQHKIELC